MINTIGILGAGTMGAGISQVAAASGCSVILRDLQMYLVKDALQSIENNYNQMIADGIMKEADKNNAMANIHGTTDLAEISRADLVIEAVVENMAIKKQIFAELDNICPEHTILASNTTSLSITEIASAIRRTEKILGMHFLNPVPSMKLVELVKGLETTDETIEIASGFCRDIGKHCVVVERDSPGYIVNRIMVPFLNEAILIYGDKLAGRDEIDTAIKLGLGMKQGPLELADRIGLDTLYSMILVFLNEYNDPKYRPHIQLSRMVRAGYLGKKTQKGFYDYVT